MPPPAQPRTAAQRHVAVAREFAARHFTDPDLSLGEAAVYVDVHERTLRDALVASGTSWRELLRDLRLARARELLRTTTYRVDDIARLSGYASAPAFAKVFREAYSASPSEYRAGQRGPRRAGRPTGAAARKSRRAAGSPDYGAASVVPSAGEQAVLRQMFDEAAERLSDRAWLEVFYPRSDCSFEEMAEEQANPRRLTDDPGYWKERHRLLQAWIDENDTPLPPGPRREWTKEDFEAMRPPRAVAE